MNKIYIKMDSHQEFQTQDDRIYKMYVRFLKNLQNQNNELHLKDSSGATVRITINDDLTIMKDK